jgi:hypothetical protein
MASARRGWSSMIRRAVELPTPSRDQGHAVARARLWRPGAGAVRRQATRPSTCSTADSSSAISACARCWPARALLSNCRTSLSAVLSGGQKARLGC